MTCRWHTTLQWAPLTAVAAVIVAGCSSQGHAVSDQDAAAQAEPAVDISALDTGTYPTSPRPPFGPATNTNLIDVEGQKMAQYVAAPFEIDRDLTVPESPVGVIHSATDIGAVIAPQAAAAPANATLLYGYAASAATPEVTVRSHTNRSLRNMVLRYQTAADAAAAAQQLATAVAGLDHHTPTTLTGNTSTWIVDQDFGDRTVKQAFTPHRDYVLYQRYSTTPQQQNMLEPALRTAIPQQTALIDHFPAIATSGGKLSGKPPVVDEHRILIYALPYSDSEIRDSDKSASSMRAVYGPRGMAHHSPTPTTDYAVLTDVGATANAIERSTVYRATTTDGARKIIDAATNAERTAGSTSIDSPPQLPAATCLTHTTGTTQYECIVQHGRYVGRTSSNTKQSAYQQISAQYVIFTKADQNAN